MADPLSISAGAVGIVSFGLSVCQALVDYYQGVKSQAKDVQKTLSSLQSLCVTLEGLDGSLHRHRFALHQVHLVENVECHIHACEEAIEDLDRELATITRRGKKSGVLESVKKAAQAAAYPFNKGTLLRLRETIQDLRENLSLALNGLQLDTLNRIQDSVGDVAAVQTLLKNDLIQANVRSWLNAPNTFGQHYEACEKRHKDTGLWFVRSQRFLNWLQHKQSFLWLNGFAGSGKTILASTIIQEIFAHRVSSPRIGLAYFYLSYADTSRQTVAGVLKSLLLQLSCQCDPAVLNELYVTYAAETPPLYALLLALRNPMKEFQHVYIVIDALDESPQGPQREALCNAINQMKQWEPVHLLITSREYADIREMLDVPLDCDISIQNEEAVADIKRCIREQLRDGSKLRKWKDWHTEIEDALCEGAGGMFRWVDCQFFALKSCLTLNMLRSTLRSLPATLDETYDKMLDSIKPEFRDFALRTLTLLCFSVRPLEVTELIEALAVVVQGDTGNFDAGNKLSGADDLLRICPGMIRVLGPAMSEYDPPSSERGRKYSDQEILRRVKRSDRRIVSLAHLSVREYLVSDHVLRSSPHFHLRPSESHLWISQLCLIYLTITDMQLPIAGVKTSLWHYGTFDFFQYAFDSWSQHARESNCSMSLMPLIRRFRACPALNVALLRITSSFSGSAELKHDVEPLLIEALMILVKWLSFEGMADLMEAVLKAPGEFFPQVSEPEVNPQRLLEEVGTDADSLERYRSRQYPVSLKELCTLDRSFAICKDPCTSLALRHSHWDVVNRLILKGFRVYRIPEMRLDPLQVAARDGESETIKLMIQMKADFKVYMSGPKLEHPIMLAAANGHAVIVKLIIAMQINGVDSGFMGPHNVSPLLIAARKGHLGTVKELINNASQACILDESGHVKLHEDAQKTILDRKTDYEMTALMAAAQSGNLEIVKALVHAGASWNSMSDIDGNSALMHALNNNHNDVAEWLIKKGADQDPPDQLGLTPKQLAERSHGDSTVFRLETESDTSKTASSSLQTDKPLTLPQQARRPSEELMTASSRTPWYSRILQDSSLKSAFAGAKPLEKLFPAYALHIEAPSSDSAVEEEEKGGEENKEGSNEN